MLSILPVAMGEVPSSTALQAGYELSFGGSAVLGLLL